MASVAIRPEDRSVWYDGVFIAQTMDQAVPSAALWQ